MILWVALGATEVVLVVVTLALCGAAAAAGRHHPGPLRGPWGRGGRPRVGRSVGRPRSRRRATPCSVLGGHRCVHRRGR